MIYHHHHHHQKHFSFLYNRTKTMVPEKIYDQGHRRDSSASMVLGNFSPNQLIMTAGAASGLLAGVVVCPLDVVKTRAQAQGALHSTKKTKVLRGYLSVFRKILQNEGIRGLYRGLVPVTIGYLPTWTIYFAAYERAKKVYPRLFNDYFDYSSSTNHFVSAVTAGMASSIAVNPIWVVKTRLMIQTGKADKGDQFGNKRTYYKGTWDAFRTMYKEEGAGVFYSGLTPSLFGLVHVGIHFPVYEKLKHILDCNRAETSPYRLILASTISKMTASTITYPHEILRTRLQMQAVTTSTADATMSLVVSSIYRRDGLRGFYAGYGINLLRTLPASAVTLVSFEYFKTYFLSASGHSI